jgi:hydroxypyruvate reductase
MKALEEDAGGDCTQREMRATAREIFLHALEECSMERAFSRKLHYERGILQVGDDLYDLGTFSRIFVISIGKAAHGSLESLMRRLGTGVETTGIVSAPALPEGQGPAEQIYGFRYFEGGHPLPNHESLRAAEAIVRALDSLNSRALVLYLISGGGSAVVEKPLSDEIPFDDLVETYRVLVHSGAPIAQINAVRKHLSAVKGGRMAVAAAPARQLSILISDVPDNALDSLASGPTMPDSSTAEQCYEIVERYHLLPRLPWSVRELLQRRWLEETPKADDPLFERARWWPILSNACAQKAAVEWAARNGFAIQIDNGCDDWDYGRAGDSLLERVRELRRGVSRVCLISGGELTVTVDGNPGRGGRNQQFALYCAQRIGGENLCVLSAGTDGIDGNSPAAGAVADGTTMARTAAKGLSAEAALTGFDAYPFFDALGDTIMTGATGTNVRDLRVLLAW